MNKPAASGPGLASDSNNGRASGIAFFLFSALFWGMNVPMTSRLFLTWDPFFLAAVRVLIASLVLVALVGATRGLAELRVPIPARRLLLLSLAMAGFFTCYNLGLRFSNPITAAAIMAGSPVYAALTMRLVVGSRLEPGFPIAAALTCIGAWIAMSGRPESATGSTRLLGGEGLILLAFVSWNLYSLGSQRWFAPQTAQLRRTYCVTLCAIPWLILVWLAAWAGGLVARPSLAPDAEAISWLMLTAVFATALAVFSWNIGVQRAGLAAGSLWQNMVPVFAVLISMLFGISPQSEQLMGGSIVLAGVLYMQWRRTRPGWVQQPS